MNQAAGVYRADSHRGADGEAQEHFQLTTHAKLSCCEQEVQGGAARVLEDEQGVIAFLDEFLRPCCPGTIQFVPQSVFVGEAIEVGAGRVLGGDTYYQRGLRAIGILATSRRKMRSPSSHSTRRVSLSSPL